MKKRLLYPAALGLLVWTLGNNAHAAPHMPQQTKPSNMMNTRIGLYQLIHDGDQISIVRVSRLLTASGSQPGMEMVTIEIDLAEKLWGNTDPKLRSYTFERPDNRIAQLKFRDSVWSRIDLREGINLLLVTDPREPDPVYVDQIDNANDPVLKSIKAVLTAEGSSNAASDQFGRRLHWLTDGTNIEKLFAGEALAREGADASQQKAQLVLSFSQVFAKETDEYVKVSLGTWLWDYIYKPADETGRIHILNATIATASVASELVRGFALDHLAEADPRLLRNPAVHPTSELRRLFEKRKEQERDSDERRKLDEIIRAIAR
jgi:hypothetical protein